MIYAEGNNREAVKIKKISVPYYIEANQNVYGRYYLSEIPEIDRSNVVGIQLNTRVSLLANYDWEQVPVINYEFSYNNITAGNSFPFDKFSTLNLVDNQDRLIIENFPVKQLITGRYSTNLSTKLKITPFDIRINTRKSYINLFYATNFPVNSIIVTNLTFFYV